MVLLKSKLFIIISSSYLSSSNLKPQFELWKDRQIKDKTLGTQGNTRNTCLMQSLVVAYNSGEPQCLKPYSALQSLMADQVEGTVAVAEPVRDASPHGASVAELQTKSGR